MKCKFHSLFSKFKIRAFSHYVYLASSSYAFTKLSWGYAVHLYTTFPRNLTLILQFYILLHFSQRPVKLRSFAFSLIWQQDFRCWHIFGQPRLWLWYSLNSKSLPVLIENIWKIVSNLILITYNNTTRFSQST